MARRSILLAAALGLAASQAASAEVFVVDQAADVVDASPGDGACDDGTGACSLRAAIQEANALPGSDEISLPAGTYLLTIAGTENAAAAGDLDVTESLTVTGAGAGVTIVDAAGAFILFAPRGAIELRLVDLTLSGGGGAAIWSSLDVSLFLERCTVRDSTGRDGAGIHADRSACLEMVDCLVEGNVAEEDAGGVHVRSTDARFAGCTFRRNASTGWGGALLASGDPTTTLLVEDCLFEDNEAGSGGGIHARSPRGTEPGVVTRVVRSHFLANVADSAGGGLFSAADTLIDDCRFEQNSATNGGGAHVSQGPIHVRCSRFLDNVADGGTSGDGGGLVLGSGDLLVEDSEFAGNRARSSGGGFEAGPLGTPTFERCTFSTNEARQGGGITAWDDLTLDSCIVRGNVAQAQGGGVSTIGAFRVLRSSIHDNESIDGSGGGLHALRTAGSLVQNTTMSGNRARNGGGAWVGLAEGDPLRFLSCTVTDNVAQTAGGIGNRLESGAVLVANTILAGNVAEGATGGPDCWEFLASAGHVLLGDASDCAYDAHPTDLVGIDPLLGPLQDNDGLTPTHHPSAGSPAIDGGDPTDCPDGAGGVLARDQRGVSRPFDGDADGTSRCDVGAVEVTSEDTSDVGLDELEDCTRTPPLGPLPDCFTAEDSDGDGVPDPEDCAPNDAGSSALPREPSLAVARDGVAALLSWSDATVNGDSDTVHELASGAIALLQAAGAASGGCLTPDTPLAHRDARPTPPGGAWYLVRGVNACGPPTGQGWGRDSLGSSRPGCP